MEITVQYNNNDDESAIHCLNHLITEAMNTDKAMTVTVYTTEIEKHWSQLKLLIDGITPKVIEEKHSMTFYNGSVIQVKQHADSDYNRCYD